MLGMWWVCSNSAEHATMERAVRQQLIPYCYRAMALKPTANAKAQLEAFKQVRHGKERAGMTRRQGVNS